jgi:hypothetical protein
VFHQGVSKRIQGKCTQVENDQAQRRPEHQAFSVLKYLIAVDEHYKKCNDHYQQNDVADRIRKRHEPQICLPQKKHFHYPADNINGRPGKRPYVESCLPEILVKQPIIK